MMEEYKFKVVKNIDDLLKAFLVRGIVFIEEQGCPYHLEFDGLDFNSTHILGVNSSEPFAAARIRFFRDYAKLERLCIRLAYRGKGLGNNLIEFMISNVKSAGFTKIKVHAQVHLINLYKNFGFCKTGDIFKEAGIDHCLMVLNLE